MTGESGRVLIVGQDAESLGGIAHCVADYGYTATIVHTTAEALAAAREATPDLVFVGADLPDTDGVAFIGQLKLLVPHEFPIVVFAAAERLQVALKWIDLGAQDYIILPLQAQVLRARLEAVTATKRALEQVSQIHREEMLLKIEQDVQTARRIQQNFLPTALPVVANWELAAKFQPAREVAGDFYDAFTLNQGRRVGVVIGDVCDKGVGAALFMALFRSLTRAFAQQHYSLRWMSGDSGDFLTAGKAESRRSIPSTGTTGLKNAMNLTNNYIIDNHGDSNMFATMFFGVIDPTTGIMVYVNAGHNPPWIFNQTGIKKRLTPTGPAVGMLPDVDYAMQQVEFAPGDILLTFTDGVPESRDETGAFFTEARMRTLINDPPPQSALELLTRIYDQLTTHIGTAAQFDDITMLAVRRQPLGAEVSGA